MGEISEPLEKMLAEMKEDTTVSVIVRLYPNEDIGQLNEYFQKQGINPMDACRTMALVDLTVQQVREVVKQPYVMAAYKEIQHPLPDPRKRIIGQG